jgi:tyrosine-protein kinase Etk/Wzc
MESNTPNQDLQQEETIQIRELAYRCLRKWYWFVISVVVCLAVGTLYILRSIPTYNTTAEIQIKSDSKGSSMPSDVGNFSDMGLFSIKSNVNNELLAFQSPDLMTKVVERLELYINYSQDGTFHPTVLYGTSLPVHAEFLDVESNISAGFVVSEGGGAAAGKASAETRAADQTVTLDEFTFKGKEIDAKPVLGRYGDTLQTPVGRIILEKTKNYEPFDKPVNVGKSGVRKVTLAYGKNLQVSLGDKNADVINLAIKDVSTQRAQDVLNTLIAVYNENWINDKNQIANSTSVFISDRLSMIESELAGVDSDISAFKSENMIPDVEAAATMYMQESTVLNQQIQEVNNQLYMARYIKDYIGKEANKNQPLPANMGLSNQSIEAGITEYNEKILQRNNLVANSGENNVLVKDLDQALASLRGAISRSIENEILALNTKLDNLQGSSRQNTARIAANPNQAKQLLSVERQQTVKQALYLFLLQKREENQLSQAFTAYNTRIIQHPVSGILPVAPQSSKILLLAFMMGLLIPAGIIYVLLSADTKIHSRQDIKALSLPFAGEIPQSAGTKFRSKKELKGKDVVVVKQGSRNAINEAFRVLRTNLEFMLRDQSKNVIAVTSFNPGSGKSFMTCNLAACLALKNKKVLVIDGDLRHGSVSTVVSSPKSGVSGYLAGIVDDVHSVILPSGTSAGFDVLPVGSIPPNPAELISGDRFGAMVGILRNEYDIVLIDCPPIDIVTDARIINAHVDRTLFVIRAGLFDKSMLPELDKLYKKGEYKNLCCVLNGTTSTKGYYGHYGYYGSSAHSYYSSAD